MTRFPRSRGDGQKSRPVSAVVAFGGGASPARVHALGLRVGVWTVNEVDEMLALTRLGIDAIITDYPDRAIKALASARSRES